MYSLPYFKAENENEVFEFMLQNPFVVLVGCDNDNFPVATQVPVLIEQRDDKLFLVGHVMKQTDHYKAFVKNSNALVVFSTSHTYISASWYKDQKQASTWNYQAVHAKGKLQFLPEHSLYDVLQKTTAHFENNDASPSLVEHLSPGYMSQLMKAIAAFEIEITSIEHVFKLSQNKDKETYKRIITELEKGNVEACAVADIMKKNAKG